MLNPLVVSELSLAISVVSGFVSWRAYRANTAMQRHSLAAAKAIAAQRLTRVLDFGLKLSVIDIQSISNFSFDKAVSADIAKSAAEAIEDVALAFPDLVLHLNEVRRNAEIGSQLTANIPLTAEQTIAVVWHYERIYTLLWLLSAYAFARHNPTGTKKPSRNASDDDYVRPFSLRHNHFMAAAFKLSGMLPAEYPVPNVDPLDDRAMIDHRTALEKMRTP